VHAALIEFNSHGFSIDVACIDDDSIALAIATRRLAIDAAGIDAAMLPVRTMTATSIRQKGSPPSDNGRANRDGVR
jgi:hypothetical protein